MIELIAPAKINLTLEVLGRREDGYHAIASIIHMLSLHDTLKLIPSPRVGARRQKLSCAAPVCIETEGFPGPTDASNLVWRALELTGATAKSSWQVKLIKRIPTEAGLGGGSSDAAAILRHFCSVPDQQGAIAEQLGSDVPFFLNGACARVEGRGEQVKPLPALPPFWWVLAKPIALGISTAWAYAQLARSTSMGHPTRPAAPTDRLEQAIWQGAIHTPEQLAPLLHNDFEPVVLPAFEPLQQLRARMATLGALRVLLCGSGAAQAALCASRQDAESMANALRIEGYWAEAVHLGL